METEIETPEAPSFTVVDEVLDNGGVTDDQVRQWEAAHARVWHVRVPFPDTDSALVRFPKAPQNDPATLLLRRYVVDCYLRAPTIEDAYAILDMEDNRRAKDEYALNRLWLGGSRLVENPDDYRKCDEDLRLAVLLRIIPEVTAVPFAVLKKSSLLSQTQATTKPATAPPAN